MRATFTALLMLSACSAAPGGEGGAYSSQQAQLKPETVAGCNAETLAVDLSADGVISVNGAPTTMDDLRAAAAKKDAACRNASAMVVYSYAPDAPPQARDAIKLLLKETIVHLTLTETSKS